MFSSWENNHIASVSLFVARNCVESNQIEINIKRGVIQTINKFPLLNVSAYCLLRTAMVNCVLSHVKAMQSLM